MIPFSTLPSGLFPAEEIQSDTLFRLTDEDETFFRSIQEKLNKELKEPQKETVKYILQYSLEFKVKD